ncbi:permease-like cell division protein FtsX [Ketobacter sp.]|uniref:permease-like cell division protein FtsX n=1 Tax=Ketobacter sp. TaxID=2083498 RepID=UPI000F275BE0|nr:permease-like cell division protein FtsX [Ketobacter sp.]RLT95097.1 MAG: cell division protein FtsX [Ketobacter sp.]
MSQTTASNQAPKGATTARTTFKQRFESWREHHKEVALESLSRLLATPLPTLMTILVIAIALSLPAGLYVMLKNAESISDDWDGSAQISLFLSFKTSAEQGRKLADDLAKRPDVKRTEYISREQALAEFEEQSGFGDLLQELGENPLPAVVVVYPAVTDLEAAEKLRLDLARKGEVDLAQLDAQWVQRLYAILDLGRRLVVALSIGLALAVLLVIINTIRLAIESRRDEIIIVKLVGGTDAFVRRPFMYTGLWYGLGGCLVALLLIQTVLWWLDEPVQALSELYRSQFQLSGLGLEVSFLMLVGSIAIGLIGARLAVSQHIRAIEPG